MLDEVNQHVAQRKTLRAHPRITTIGRWLGHQRQRIDAESLPQLAAAQDALQHLASISHAADLDDHSYPLVVCLVTQVSDTTDLALVHLASDALQQCGLLHSVRQLGDDDVGLAPTDVLQVHPRLRDDAPAASLVGGTNGV